MEFAVELKGAGYAPAARSGEALSKKMEHGSLFWKGSIEHKWPVDFSGRPACL
jgi:hypothetical protein